MQRGSCQCGAVRVEVTTPLAAPDACHCRQCRQFSGHYFVSTDVPRDALAVHGAEHVTWFQDNDRVRRGFCSVCGSSLFWEPQRRDWVAVAMGVFAGSTETRLSKHIFVREKGDYYELTDGVAQSD